MTYLKPIMKMKTIKLIVLLICCSIASTAVLAQSKPYVDGNWQIKTIKDSGKMIDLSGKETSVKIDTKAKSLMAYVGCNRMTSTLEFITSDIIKPFQLTSTRKSCKDTDALESTTRYVLEQTNSVRKNGAKLEFYKDTELLMVLERPTDTKKKKK
jgi:heat shock protein HslJ